MAQIMKIEEFVNVYRNIIRAHDMKKLLEMKPGESHVLVFGRSPRDHLVFIRVTEYHMAKMSVYEFNGIS